MPHYFFDVVAGERQLRDERGRDVFDRFLAGREADAILGALREVARIGDHPEEIVVRVRDEAGLIVYEARDA